MSTFSNMESSYLTTLQIGIGEMTPAAAHRRKVAAHSPQLAAKFRWLKQRCPNPEPFPLVFLALTL